MAVNRVPLRTWFEVSPGNNGRNPTSEFGSAVREQVDRVLSSSQFVRSERLGRLLRAIVESGLRGEVNGLKESVLGREVYDRGDDFDGRIDPIVRTEMRRLRRKLTEYYDDAGSSDPVLIEIPKGAYVPSIRVRDAYRPRMQGESLGPYRVVERLSTGASGIMYRVVEPATGDEFAAKQLSADVCAKAETIASLKAELRTTEPLSAESASRIEAVDETVDGILLRAGFRDGITLEEFFYSEDLQWAAAHIIATQLLAALAAAHHAGVVHGHLKPSDVLLAEGERDLRVTILNFGTRALAARILVNRNGRQVGTAGYAQSHATADRSSDVRSLGAILCQLFTGSLPAFRTHTGAFEFRFAADVPEQRREGLATLLANCLAVDPAERFADAAEAAAAYTRVSDIPVREASPSHAPPATIWRKAAQRVIEAIRFAKS